MDTLLDRARGGPAGAKARQGLTDAKLRDLPPRERAYKVSDGGNGLYVVVSPSDSRSFRYDYRLGGRRETLTIGRHEPVARHAQRSHLAYGMDVTLEEARFLLARARVDVSSGRSPARAKVEQRSEVADAMSFGRWATRYLEFKSDAKSGAERLADSTLSLRRSIYNRILAVPFGKLNLDEIKPVALGELLDRVKSERGPGPAVHARELVLQVYRFAAGKGVEVDNPAEALARKAYATFVPRERNLSRHEIKALLDGLEQTGTAPTLRLAVRFVLLTGVRKGEFIGATWSEVDWERAQRSIPAERMKAGKPHTVYLAEQALDILTTLRTCFPSSKYVHPSRYDSGRASEPGHAESDDQRSRGPDQPGSSAGSGAVSAGLRPRFAPNVLVTAQRCTLPGGLDRILSGPPEEGPGSRRLQPCAPVGARAGPHASVGGHAGLLDARQNSQGGHRPRQGEN